MHQHLKHLNNLKEFGSQKGDRTGTGTVSLFGSQQSYDLTNGKIPLLTTKKVLTSAIIHELIWFLKGEGNIQYLKENGVKIWDDWADENGDLGPVYGVQWRHWDDTRVISEAEWDRDVESLIERGFSQVGWDSKNELVIIRREIDQIADLVDQIKNNPNSRRMILTAWNPSVVEEQALPPCHSFVQFYSRELSDNERLDLANRHPEWRKVNFKDFDKAGVPSRALSCQLYQRSADWFLGVPFNIASYSILTHMLAHVTGHVAEKFVHTCGDSHLYNNHFEQAEEQMSRTMMLNKAKVRLNPEVTNIDGFKFEDILIEGYEHHGFIAAPVAV